MAFGHQTGPAQTQAPRLDATPASKSRPADYLPRRHRESREPPAGGGYYGATGGKAFGPQSHKPRFIHTMKTNPASVSAFLTLLAVLAVIPAAATENPTPPKTEAEIKGEAAKLALKELDVEIERVDQLIDNAPSQAERAAGKARLAVLKDRRTALRKTYVKALYDELRADLQAEARRQAVTSPYCVPPLAGPG